jgi:DNA (cytosine-5)-methyltransferase 1
MKKKIKVVELFAGVGGFRLGLEGFEGKSATSNYTKKLDSNFEVVWSNQFEPSTKIQHASDVYESIWGEDCHSRTNIEDVVDNQIDIIPEHDLLVGGFPCQDYSVATTLKNSKGIVGKKGVLWWSIYKILNHKIKSPKYVLLENVDRLLISPSKQRGRDFAIILKCLDKIDFAVEWRIINAAEYGFPQRRKRVFILAYHKSTSLYKELSKSDPLKYIIQDGVIANTFPVAKHNASSKISSRQLNEALEEISESFKFDNEFEKFENAGVMINGKVHSIKTKSNFDDEFKVLKDIILEEKVDDEFYLDDKTISMWEYLKGAKKDLKTNSLGIKYNYTEGAMVFPDSLDKASRTIITGEGGKSPSRFKHVIRTKFGVRRLTPIELERLNMFPDNHTKLEGITDVKRAFFMGNALVVGVVEKIGLTLSQMMNRK